MSVSYVVFTSRFPKSNVILNDFTIRVRMQSSSLLVKILA